ncbi:hypothetical protein PSTT_10444, partial [Puccinia striiformis]
PVARFSDSRPVCIVAIKVLHPASLLPRIHPPPPDKLFPTPEGLEQITTYPKRSLDTLPYLSNHADGRCQRIVDTFPNNAAAADAMRTIVQYEQNFGTALAQSKRPVGGDATDLPANLNIVRGYLKTINAAIQMIQKDMWKIDNKLTIIEKYALPNLSYSKSSNLNEEIENTIQHSNHADGRCQRIVDTFPNSAAAADAMRTILQYGQAFGTALAQSKRPVGGDATDLPANLNTVRGYLRTINAARNTLIGVAQSGDATSFWT